ncbi:MAG: transposase zinc-binding domain-containing protein [Deltaproteobacteria bacterium]|nr:transposase zinc-binding domain-containing protein [Deltaproteobacteria bacterium]
MRCKDCGHEQLVAFSCKGRGLCPSCQGRRMAETAARLTEALLPSAC